MKLKNKKTGEIGYLIVGKGSDHYVVGNDEWDSCGEYNSLVELNEEWEDYEEPKEHWYINEFGTPTKADFVGRETLYDKCRKDFGNYFETEEEAEKAVEKLKAWKRLKDKGFRFSKWFTRVEGGIQINMEYNKYDGIDLECRNDLDFLFGGGE